MSGNPFFSGRIPPDLFERAEQHCDESGISKTELLIAALRSYLDYPEPPKPVEVAPERVTKLEQQIEEVWKAIAQLQKKTKVSDTVNDNRADNKESFPKYLLNESEMARMIGLDRGTLKNRRAKMQASQSIPHNVKTATIEKVKCNFWYWGSKSRGASMKIHLWAAHPIDNGSDN